MQSTAKKKIHRAKQRGGFSAKGRVLRGVCQPKKKGEGGKKSRINCSTAQKYAIKITTNRCLSCSSHAPHSSSSPLHTVDTRLGRMGGWGRGICQAVNLALLSSSYTAENFKNYATLLLDATPTYTKNTPPLVTPPLVAVSASASAPLPRTHAALVKLQSF